MAMADAFIVEGFTYFAISIVVIAFRIYCRSKQAGVGTLGVEDYLMILAIIPLTIETALAYNVGALYHGLDNSAMTDEQRASLSPDSDEYKMRVNGSKTQVAGWFLYLTTIWIIKASMCTFYLRLTAGLDGYKSRIYIGFGIIAASYSALILSLLTSCRPFHHYWQINPDPGNFCEAAINKLNVYLSMILNLTSDLYLFFIPIPMLWAARLPRIKRIGLIVLFSGGILIMIFGILRCTAILQSASTGPKEGAYWAIRESFVAVTTTNLPMTWGWVSKKLRPLLGSLLSSERSTGAKTGRRTGPEPGSIMLGDTGTRTWHSQQDQTVIYANQKGVRNDVFIQSGNDSSEENILISSNGITKAVDYSVSSTAAPAKDSGL